MASTLPGQGDKGGVMVRPVHHHHGSEGTIGPCQCAEPSAETPTDYPRRDRPPPTSYRDGPGRFHPGPGREAYAGHVAVCFQCWDGLREAAVRGEAWAIKESALRRLPAPTLLPGPGEGAGVAEQHDRHALLYLRPHHIGPAALAVGVLAYVLASLVWWIAVPCLVALGAVLVYAERNDLYAIDRTPRARVLRQARGQASGIRQAVVTQPSD